TSSLAPPALHPLPTRRSSDLAVVGSRTRPARLGATSGTHRVPGILARGLGGIGGKGALRRRDLIGAPGLAARELPTHEQLVGLAHPHACGRLAHAALPSR